MGDFKYRFMVLETTMHCILSNESKLYIVTPDIKLFHEIIVNKILNGLDVI